MILEKIQTQITEQCDVCVCGGGIAGIAAALAAARCNKRVILVEKGYMLGGLATAGLVTIYLPLCDGKGNQVSFGIAEELLRLSISMGAEDMYPANWLDSDYGLARTEEDNRFEVRFNPQLFAMLAEQLLLKENVKILYGTYAVAVDKREDKINAVVIENKSGRQAIEVNSVVDATGDCDIACFAGAPTESFKQGNILAGWYYSVGSTGYQLQTLGVCDIPEEQKTENNQVEVLLNRRFDGLEGEELSEMMQLSHNAILADISKRREKEENLWPVTIPTIPQIRMTRRLVGEYTLGDDEMHRRFVDSMGMVSDWRKRGPVYEVPFRSLYCKEVRNLITAGRCVSVTESMWDIMRVIPCCAVTGQAAGTAAAMTDDFVKMDVSSLQEKLKEHGVVLHLS